MSNATTGVLSHQPTGIYSNSKVFKVVTHIARVLLGLIFFVFGLNGFLHFIPMGTPTATAAEFVYGLVKAQYLLPLMAAIQVASGALLLSGFFIPFAVLLLFPITVNIFFFHLALDPTGIGMAIFILAANLLLAVYYWPVYKPIFSSGNAWKSRIDKQH